RKSYLKPGVMLEPLINQWYAWPHLISPATAAMNMVNAHIRMMRSFIAAPDVHAAAVRNPEMRGGPFVDWPKSAVKDVGALFDKTTREQAHIIKFAEGLNLLNEMLLNEGKGPSLDPLHARMSDH